jgi:shikimate kinase/DNA-binding XRE family transcriptional regulator
MMGADEVDSFFASVGSRQAGREVENAAGDPVFLRAVGRRLRAARTRLKMPLQMLANEAGVSERYIRLTEAGGGNVSLRILQALAVSLSIDPLDLLAERPDSPLHRMADRLEEAERVEAFQVLRRHFANKGNDPRTRRIALVGLPATGAAAVGARLAAARGVRFVVFEEAVAAASGRGVGDVFQKFSQAAVQRVQRRVLEEEAAAGGGLVMAVDAEVAGMPRTMEALLRTCRTVWLRLDAAAVARAAPERLGKVQTRHLGALLAAQEAMLGQADEVLDVAGWVEDEIYAAVLLLLG